MPIQTVSPSRRTPNACPDVPTAIDDELVPARSALETRLRDAIKEALGASKFDLWFGAGVRLGIVGDALRVSVPNQFFFQWIKNRYGRHLQESARQVTGRTVSLRFEIQDSENDDPSKQSDPFNDGNATQRFAPEPSSTSAQHDDELGTQKEGEKQTSPPETEPRTGTDRSSPRVARRALGVGPDPDQVDAALQIMYQRPTPHGSTPPKRRLRSLDSFVVGSSNRLAHASALEMVASGGSAFNPLIFYGGVGLGKTHLLEGITEALRASKPGLNLSHMTAENFTNEFLESMRGNRMSGFRSKHRAFEALIVDDVHFLASKRATQDEFLHTFNSLTDRGGLIVLAIDDHPRRVSRLTEELATRFLGGMVVKLEPPDVETRAAILRAKAVSRRAEVPEPVIIYLAENFRGSVRELEGALSTLIAHASLIRRRIDINLARVVLRETIHHTARAIALRDVERAVCKLFQIDSDRLKGESRSRSVTQPRMIAMYLARRHTSASYSEIGRHFGGRNHSTVIAAEKKVTLWTRDENRQPLLEGFQTVSEILDLLETKLQQT